MVRSGDMVYLPLHPEPPLRQEPPGVRKGPSPRCGEEDRVSAVLRLQVAPHPKSGKVPASLTSSTSAPRAALTPLTHRLLSGSPGPGSSWAGRPRSTGGSAGGRPATATRPATAVATHARRGVTGSWHVVGVDGRGLGGQWLPLGLGHGRDEGGLHKPLEVLAGCDRGDRGHEGTGHFPKTGALLRGDTYTHRRRHTNRYTDTHTPSTHTHTDPVSEHRASGCGCVCHRQKATTPTLPLHRDAVVNERISVQLASTSSFFLGERLHGSSGW